MNPRDDGVDLDLSRRRRLAAAGHAAGVAATGSLAASGPAAAAGVSSGGAPDPATPPVAGLHLQFGADASSQMVVSWHTLQPVQRPRVLLGRLDGRLEQTVAAATARRAETSPRRPSFPFTMSKTAARDPPFVTVGMICRPVRNVQPCDGATARSYSSRRWGQFG